MYRTIRHQGEEGKTYYSLQKKTVGYWKDVTQEIDLPDGKKMSVPRVFDDRPAAEEYAVAQQKVTYRIIREDDSYFLEKKTFGIWHRLTKRSGWVDEEPMPFNTEEEAKEYIDQVGRKLTISEVCQTITVNG